MKEQQSAPQDSIQINLIGEQRKATRDYNEYFIPSSIKLVLATWTQEKRNSMALDNSNFFRYRFGFEPPKVARQQVLEIQKKHDLTDREVRWLHRSGQLKVTRTEAKLIPSRLMPAAGWIQVSILSFFCLAMTLQIAASNAPAWKQALGQLIISGLWFGGACMLNSLLLAPWRTLKRAGVVKAAKGE